MGILTRKEMEGVIAAGGSVLYNGQTIWLAGQLPTEADLAAGDPAQETIVASAIQAQMVSLQAQLDKLSGAQVAETADVPPNTGGKKGKSPAADEAPPAS